MEGSTVAVMNMKNPCSTTALVSTTERRALSAEKRPFHPCAGAMGGGVSGLS